MKTIRIPCDAVVIGDILAANAIYPRRVVYGFYSLNARLISPKTTEVHDTVGQGNAPRMPAPVEQWTPDTSVEVERSVQLTPAQQHADELLELVQSITCENRVSLELHGAACALINKIDPPKPVTLDEALAMLDRARSRVMNDPGFCAADIAELLDRARRSGVLS